MAYEISNGTVCGVVTKFSRHGLFWKTYEGELLCSGVRKTSNEFPSVTPNIFSFSFDATVSKEKDNWKLRKDIEDSMFSGRQVCLNYYRPLINTPCMGLSGRILTGVESHFKSA